MRRPDTRRHIGPLIQHKGCVRLSRKAGEYEQFSTETVDTLKICHQGIGSSREGDKK